MAGVLWPACWKEKLEIVTWLGEHRNKVGRTGHFQWIFPSRYRNLIENIFHPRAGLLKNLVPKIRSSLLECGAGKHDEFFSSSRCNPLSKAPFPMLRCKTEIIVTIIMMSVYHVLGTWLRCFYYSANPTVTLGNRHCYHSPFKGKKIKARKA